MLNNSLLNVRSFVVIGLMTALVHVVARPLYNLVDKKGS